MSSKPVSKAGPRSAWRYFLPGVISMSALFGGVFTFQRVEQYLIANPRFRFEAPAEYGEDAPGLRIEGISHASKVRLMQVFAPDFGRSVYLMPLAERRRNLLAVNWVKDASVSRIWPHDLVVRISEREPVAFLTTARADRRQPFRYRLIDADGFILDPPPRVSFHLPVVAGIGVNDELESRRQRIRKCLRFFKEIGPMGAKLSEVDVGDLGNLKATWQVDEGVAVLMLGGADFAGKLKNFEKHYPEIRTRFPQAAMFDLRIEDRITVVGGAGNG